MSTCANCGRDRRGDRAFCATCVTAVDECLVSLYRRPKGANLLDELFITATRQSRLTDPLGGRGGAETPMVFNVLAAARYGLLVRFLRSSARHYRVHLRRDAFSLRAARVDTAWIYAAWLHRLWPQISQATDAADFVATLLRLVSDAWAVIDRPPDQWFAGRCASCEADMYALEGAATVKCRTCGTVVDIAVQRERLLAAVDDVLATATEISRAVHITGSDVTPSKITNLYHRGKLVRYGRNRTGDHLYRVGDVLAVVDAQRARQA
jgi:hypothetical protein